jgi:hypothetical protein
MLTASYRLIGPALEDINITHCTIRWSDRQNNEVACIHTTYSMGSTLCLKNADEAPSQQSHGECCQG